MKRTSEAEGEKRKDLKAEYRFDYSKARPNRFTAEMNEATVAVVLDPDVASVFATSEAVNAALRSMIAPTPNDRP